MFAFRSIEQQTSGVNLRMTVPLWEYLSSAYEQGDWDSVYMSLRRMEELRLAERDDSPILQPHELNKKYGLPTLEFKHPEKESVAILLHERKKKELSRMYDLMHGSNGLFSMRTVGMFAATMLGAAMNPLDLALLFVPIVGSSTRAAQITQTGFRAGINRAFARSLITRESLQQFPAPRLIESVLQGAGGGALLTVPTYVASKQEQALFTEADFVMGVALMGALSVGLHGAARGFNYGSKAFGQIFNRVKQESTRREKVPGDLLSEIIDNTRQAKKLFDDLPRGTRIEMARTALNQVLHDKPVDVSNFVKIDDAVIRAQVEEEFLSMAKARIDEELIREQVFQKYYRAIVAAAMKDLRTGKVYTGPAHWAIPEYYSDPYPFERFWERGYMTNEGVYISEAELSRRIGILADDLTSEKLIRRADIEELTPQEESHYLDLVEEEKKTHEEAISIIRKEQQNRRRKAFWTLPENQARFEEAKKKAIAEVIEKLRQEHDPEVIFARLRQAEIERQIREGKIMPPEDVEKHTYKDFSDAKQKLEKQIKELREKGVSIKSVEEKSITDQAIELAEKLLEELNKPSQ